MADAPLRSHCSACQTPLSPGDRFCSGCGARADQQPPAPTASFEMPARRAPSSSAVNGERFAPGQILLQRFRIVTPLGRGGMGEVFRADDLALGQSVALKFLPRDLAQDADRLQRLRGEVKTARQVAHPHVCRVYDLDEADGHLFISMEFIDGQNLGALLTQINRLPEERGIEIARQLCLGLGAIHDRGLLHRDLKPGNVMLDGRGLVRITDFGLAAPMQQIAAAEIRDGTPAYQSPEQLAGREVTPRSDIYALGLILYELFTGKRPFTATGRAELARSHAEDPPSRPSSHVSGLNPAIERIVLKCLEKEPRDRPRTAYEVLAALPSGDPLQAALAAGQTPSPAVVADAKIEGSLHPLLGFVLLLATLIGMACIAAFGAPLRLWHVMPHQLSPRDLAVRAQEWVSKFGHSETPRDWTYGLATSKEMLTFLIAREPSAGRWQPLATGQPPAAFFWYRQSPTWLRSLDRESTELFSHHGQASADNPASTKPGMVRLCLDLQGRLIEFQAISRREPQSAAPPTLDWPAIFSQSGLADMRPLDQPYPTWAPPVFADQRLAWDGKYADSSAIPVHAEAALHGGRLVFFHVAPQRDSSPAISLFAETSPLADDEGWPRIIFSLILFVILSVSLALAWHNVRLGRANLRGTAILGLWCFALLIVQWLFSAHHIPDFFDALVLLQTELGHVAWVTAQLCMYYLALEPYVRRRWPWRMIAWNRLLAGRWRDPLVGRDVLLGAAAGASIYAIWLAINYAAPWLGQPPQQPETGIVRTLTAGPILGLADALVRAPGASLSEFLLLFFFYLLVRREWLAAVLFIIFFVAVRLLALPEDNRVMLLVMGLAILPAQLLVMMRWGVLSWTAACVTAQLLESHISLDRNAWYFGDSLVYLAVLASLVLYGFFTASSGQALAWIGYLTGESPAKPEAALAD